MLQNLLISGEVIMIFCFTHIRVERKAVRRCLVDSITNVQAWDKNGTKLLVETYQDGTVKMNKSTVESFRKKYDLDPTDVIKYNCLPGEMFEDPQEVIDYREADNG